ncbi:hypothetical protein PMAYCL1PPCAC_31422, partial [Pristionchus mayeri]
ETEPKKDLGSERSEETQNLRIFNGAFNDFRKRFPHYVSDFTDAFEYRCLVTVIFMFFACIAPSITFGGLMGKYTDERMGTTETLLAQSLCGVIWGLFSCQPFIIQSATGPVLIFEASLYRLCTVLGLDLLSVRFFAGIWIFLICMIVVAFEGSWLLKYVTRFTEEIFAVMISGIFIFESINFMRKTNSDNPVEDYTFYEHQHHDCNQTEISARPCQFGEPNTTLLTGLILFMTFVLACSLRYVRSTIWFGKHVRNIFGDFGVFIAISVVAFLTQQLFPDPILARLEMPEHLNFTNLEKRGHGIFVIPRSADTPISIGVAGAAALLVFILIFVETEITELLLSRKKRGLVKGSGLNWDLVLVGFCCLLCSLFGLPWMCAAAVQSLAHCSSLTITKKDKLDPNKMVVDRVIEQRVTTICVSLLIGAFAFLGSVLRLPMASLFGVFLYLGVMNLAGIELVKRTALFFVPVKYHWVTAYTKTMKVWRIHLYTLIQLVLVVIISIVKQGTYTALAFPFVLILFIVFRHTALPRIFTAEELEALDADEDHEEKREDRDGYTETALPV